MTDIAQHIVEEQKTYKVGQTVYIITGNYNEDFDRMVCKDNGVPIATGEFKDYHEFEKHFDLIEKAISAIKHSPKLDVMGIPEMFIDEHGQLHLNIYNCVDLNIPGETKCETVEQMSDLKFKSDATEKDISEQMTKWIEYGVEPGKSYYLVCPDGILNNDGHIIPLTSESFNNAKIVHNVDEINKLIEDYKVQFDALNTMDAEIMKENSLFPTSSCMTP